MRILVAEDDKDSMRLVTRSLRRWGYDVIAVENGARALSVLQTSNPPLLALLDWNMPELDGLDVVERLRAENCKEYIYTILLTARSEREDMLRGLSVGADDYVKKPFDKGELRARLLAGERVVRLKQELESRNEALQSLNRDLEDANRRMQKDLQTAAGFQNSLLPRELPQAAGMELAWRYEPCEELAGDMLNAFWLDEEHIALYTLDVSGHGVAASFLTGMLSRILSPADDSGSLVRTRIPDSDRYEITPPARVASRLCEQFMYENESDQYFTLLYSVVNIKTHELRLVSAGHPRPIVVSGTQGPTRIEVKGLPVGFLQGAVYEEATIVLQPGDRLYLFSDGLLEAVNSAGEVFGESRLMQVLGHEHEAQLSTTLATCFDRVSNWTAGQPADDLSILALRIDADA